MAESQQQAIKSLCASRLDREVKGIMWRRATWLNGADNKTDKDGVMRGRVS